VKHINVLLRCSLVVTAVALLRSLLRSALLRSSLIEPIEAKKHIKNFIRKGTFSEVELARAFICTNFFEKKLMQ